ncbi:SRPBCC family protein [Nocardioides dilutus]
MTQQEVAIVIESGYSCFAVFGAEPVGAEDDALGGTLLEWLQPAADMPPDLIVKAGAQFGTYDVTIRVSDGAAPPSIESSWEDVSEVSVACQGPLALGDLEDGPGEELPVSPGAYRLRVSARGRTESAAREAQFPDDAQPDGAEEPLEHYLLELWPAAIAPPSVVREQSQFARDLVSPPTPDWPVEREPGLEAARRVAADLRGPDGSRRLSGDLGEVLVIVEVPGTPTRIFNRVKHANGWPPSNGGALSLNESVGDRCSHYGAPPDSNGLAPLLGMLETTVLEIDKPKRFAMSWNWRVAGPDGRPYPTNPRLLQTDSTVTMSFAKGNAKDEEARTRVKIHHVGVPVEWVDDLHALWAWDVTVFTRR